MGLSLPPNVCHKGLSSSLVDKKRLDRRMRFFVSENLGPLSLLRPVCVCHGQLAGAGSARHVSTLSLSGRIVASFSNRYGIRTYQSREQEMYRLMPTKIPLYYTKLRGLREEAYHQDLWVISKEPKTTIFVCARCVDKWICRHPSLAQLHDGPKLFWFKFLAQPISIKHTGLCDFFLFLYFLFYDFSKINILVKILHKYIPPAV